MLKFERALFFAFICMVVTSACAQTSEITLRFKVGNSLAKEVSLESLQKDLNSHDIGIYDSEYKLDKNYRAFRFIDVLKYVYGKEVEDTQWSSVSFTALDGYEAVGDINNVLEEGGYLTYADLDFEDWQEIPGHPDTRPGPFYLVWENKAQTTKTGYPWPWQIGTISLISRADQYSAAFPKGNLVNENVMAGYELFMSRCISCHSISGQGGAIGPDLNAPQNVLRYRSEAMVRSFISRSSEYRYSKMPDFVDLSDAKIDNLLDYLSYLNRAGRAD